MPAISSLNPLINWKTHTYFFHLSAKMFELITKEAKVEGFLVVKSGSDYGKMTLQCFQ